MRSQDLSMGISANTELYWGQGQTLSLPEGTGFEVRGSQKNAMPTELLNSEHYAETTPQRTGVRGTLQGLLVTLKNLLKGFVGDIPTIQYPDGRRNYSRRFRGIHVLLSKEDGSPRCVACYMCATACPADCIEIEAAEHPDSNIEKYPSELKIDLLRCVFCGLCVEACPKEAIVMTRNYETGFHSRGEAIYSTEKLLEKAKLPEKDLGYRPRYSP